MSTGVQIIEINAKQEGQRLDNVLRVLLKGVPKSAIYRLIRTGQVRINGKRCKPMQRVVAGDQLRLPPVKLQEQSKPMVPDKVIEQLREAVIFQDESYLVLDKPAGLAVHGGSGLSFGVIDAVHSGWRNKDISLAHRLDRETSGCLVLAMDRMAQQRFELAQRESGLHKRYLALLQGHLAEPKMNVSFALSRSRLEGGERMVVIDPKGKPARSRFRVLEQYQQADFVEVELFTGRTHQIRVHAAASGNPLAGDQKYGDRQFNRKLRSQGLTRMFLHASRVDIPLGDAEIMPVHAPLPDDLRQVLNSLSQRRAC